MNANEVLPLIFNNISPKCIEEKSEKKACECIDPCVIQYYCPQPITNARLAHAYVPFQFLQCLYTPEKGLRQGTIFPELDRAYSMDVEYTVDQ